MILAHSLTIPISPKSQQFRLRAKALGKGRILSYNDPKKLLYMNHIQGEVKSEAPDTPHEGPLYVCYRFYLDRPASKKIDPDGELHANCSGPDCSNLVKTTEDALTAAGFWKDDSLCSIVHLAKFYTDEDTPPRIEVDIYLLSDFERKNPEELQHIICPAD